MNNEFVILYDKCIISLAINPLRPRSVPECEFTGPHMLVEKFRLDWNKNLTTWYNIH